VLFLKKKKKKERKTAAQPVGQESHKKVGKVQI
jgi:hypothetical protein